MDITLKLTKVAKSKGGDRYEGTVAEEPNPLVIYLPQSITRKSGKPYETIDISIIPKS